MRKEKMIKQIFNGDEKKRITRQILETLPDWFGIPEAREDYIKDSVEQIFFAAAEQEREVGFIYLKETGKYKEYDETNRFYINMGFKEFEVFPTLWDEWNPCQIYVIALK